MADLRQQRECATQTANAVTRIDSIMMASLAALPPDALTGVCSFLETHELLLVGGACRSLYAHVSSSDSLWRHACVRDWLVDVPPGSSASDARHAWLRDFARCGSCYKHRAYARARRLWGRFVAWAEAHYPEVLLTLQVGTTDADLTSVETRLACSLPPSYRALMLAMNGQFLSFPSAPFSGILGGHHAYNEMLTTNLLGVEDVATTTELLRSLSGDAYDSDADDESVEVPRPALALDKRYVVIANQNLHHEVPTAYEVNALLLDTLTGHVWMCDLRQSRVFAPVAPLLHWGRPDPDCLLHWLEEYVSRLEAGIYRVKDVDTFIDSEQRHFFVDTSLPGLPPAEVSASAAIPDSRQWLVDAKNRSRAAAMARLVRRGIGRYICTFPEAGRGCTSYADTLGVHVHVSCVLDTSDPPHGKSFYWNTGPPDVMPPVSEECQAAWRYRVRLWYDDERSHGAPSAAASEAKHTITCASTGTARWPSVQLQSRRWVITSTSIADDGTERLETPPEGVEGPGVIGQFPLLRPLPAGLRCVASTDPSTVAAYAAPRGEADIVNGLPHPRYFRVDGGGGASTASGSEGKSGRGSGSTATASPPADASVPPMPFEYVSRTQINSLTGYVEGAFTMVPGKITRPAGPSFAATISRWRLEVPEFIY